MDRRRFLVTMLAGALGALLAAAFLGLGAGRPAMAAGGGAGITEKGLLAVTTGAPGDDANRLVMVDTSAKRLLVYRILPGSLRLMAARSYIYDMKIEDSGSSTNGGYSLERVRELALLQGVKEEDLRTVPKGREMLLTTDAASAAQDGNRIVLVNPEEKRILVYRLNGNSLLLAAARRFDADMALDFTKDVSGNGLTREEVLKLVGKGG
jgi:hypothetical protein